jgi:NADPH:quinone reductase-like Zn-dependent oxidoreductase
MSQIFACIQIPASLSFEGAATFPIAFATAALGLYQDYRARGGLALTAPWDKEGSQKYAGQPVLVTGGASSVGQFGSYSCPSRTSLPTNLK